MDPLFEKLLARDRLLERYRNGGTVCLDTVQYHLARFEQGRREALEREKKNQSRIEAQTYRFNRQSRLKTRLAEAWHPVRTLGHVRGYVGHEVLSFVRARLHARTLSKSVPPDLREACEKMACVVERLGLDPEALDNLSYMQGSRCPKVEGEVLLQHIFGPRVRVCVHERCNLRGSIHTDQGLYGSSKSVEYTTPGPMIFAYASVSLHRPCSFWVGDYENFVPHRIVSRDKVPFTLVGQGSVDTLAKAFSQGVNWIRDQNHPVLMKDFHRIMRNLIEEEWLFWGDGVAPLLPVAQELLEVHEKS